MLQWLNNLLGRGSYSALDPRHKVKLHGIAFTLRKLDPLDYMKGAHVMTKYYETYGKPGVAALGAPSDGMIEKVREHYKDVLMCGVVTVRLNGKEYTPSRKDTVAGEFTLKVDNLMTDWTLAEELYAAILEFTYGKKKLTDMLSQKKN